MQQYSIVDAQFYFKAVMQNINFILTDNTSPELEKYISENNIFPIQSAEGYDQLFVLIPNQTDDHFIRLFINDDSSIPDGYFVFDFFDSGQIYLNASTLTNKISCAQVNLRSFLNLIFSNTATSLTTYPNSSGSTIFMNGFIVESFELYRSGMYGWKIPIEGFFGDIPENIVTTKQKQLKISPICKYYSHNNIVSKDYRFANIISNFQSCSSHKRNNFETTLNGCLFEPRKQSDCPLYEPDISVIMTKEVKMFNSNSSEKFTLEHFYSRTGYNSFSIICGNDNVLNNIVTPPEISYDEALTSATDIFEKYLECYTEATITRVDSIKLENVAYESLILTAVG